MQVDGLHSSEKRPARRGQGLRSNVGTRVRTLDLTPSLRSCWNVLTPHLSRCWNVLTPPSGGLLCVALHTSQKMDKICDLLHKKAKMWLKVVINRHLDLKNGLNRQLSPIGTTYHHFWLSDHTWLNTVLTPHFAKC